MEMNVYTGTSLIRYDTDTQAKTLVGTTSKAWSFQEAMETVYGDACKPESPAETETAVRKKLSAEELAELAGKYDPHHMTQGQYDSFLEDLMEKDALSKLDAMQVGYKGFRVLDIDPAAFGTGAACGTACIIRQEDLDDGLVQSLDDAGGDLLRWVQIMLSREYAGTDLWTQNSIREKEEVLSHLSDILNRMGA